MRTKRSCTIQNLSCLHPPFCIHGSLDIESVTIPKDKILKLSSSVNSEDLIFTGSTLWSAPLQIKKHGSSIFALYNSGLQILSKEYGDIFIETGRVLLQSGQTIYYDDTELEFMGNHILAQLDQNIYMIDISDIENPHVISKVSLNGSSYKMTVGNGYIYVTYVGGFQIIKINSSSLDFIKSVTTEDEWRGSCGIFGSNLYVGGNGLYIYDISTPESPALKTFVPDPWGELNVGFDNFSIKNDYMFLIHYYPQIPGNLPTLKIAIFGFDSDGIPVNLFARQFTGMPHHLNIENEKMYVSDYGCGVRVFDIHDPSSPIPLINYRPSGSVDVMDIKNNSLLHYSHNEWMYQQPCSTWISDVPLVAIQDKPLRGMWENDLSILNEPQTIGSKPIPPDINGVNSEGNYVFAQGGGDIYVVDASDETDAKVISFIKTPGLHTLQDLKEAGL